jgi:prepilin-type N-terminal cleavage/methylation domain-containing protein
MLSRKPVLARSRRATADTGARGFSLIELMVALVVGLIVSAAAISFVVSVAKANSEDIQVTRLTQELRSVSEVITREIRRARFVSDPIGNVAQGGAPPLVNDAVTGANIDAVNKYFRCITLVYDRPPTEAAGTLRRTIYWNTTDNRVYLSDQATCTGGQAISSPEVTISRLSFDDDTNATNTPAAIDGFVRIVVAGRLSAGRGDLQTLTRSFQQDTYIRSGKVD